MIITIDTDEIARRLLSDGAWTAEEFANHDAPSGWSFAILDELPELEQAVYNKCIELLNKG